jgi:hypothetical protein
VLIDVPLSVDDGDGEGLAPLESCGYDMERRIGSGIRRRELK